MSKPFEYSSNVLDLKMDIGMTIQLIQSGEISSDDEIEHLRGIETALYKIFLRMSGDGKND